VEKVKHMRGKVFGGRVIFDRLKKTAGQSISLWLRQELGYGCVTHLDLEGNHRDLIRRYGGEYSVINAHVHFQDGEGLDPRYQYATVLRAPVDRVVSWLHFMKHNHHMVSSPQLANTIAQVNRFLDSDGEDTAEEIVGELSNLYVEHFWHINSSGLTCDDDKLTNALAAIQQYNVVGIYEDLPQFLAEMAGLIGLPRCETLTRFNVTRKRPKVDSLSPALRNRIIELNQLDLRLYEEVVAWKASVPNYKKPGPRKMPCWQKYEPRTEERRIVSPDVIVTEAKIREGKMVRHGQLMTFDVGLFLTRGVNELEMGIHIFDSDHRWAYGTNTTLLRQHHSAPRGFQQVSYYLVADLPVGAYTAGFACAERLPEGVRELFWRDALCQFEVYHHTSGSFAGYANLPAEISVVPISHNAYHFDPTGPFLLTQVGRPCGNKLTTTKIAGCLLYGPYIALPAGDYRVTISGALGENGDAGARAEIVIDHGETILARSAMHEPDENGSLISLPVSLEAPCKDLEVRVWVEEQSEVTISMVEVEPLQGFEL
jgi:hypothetical protein